MIRLGHIDYTNCIPLHAPFLEGGCPDVAVVRGVPSELNRALAAGTIDVAPCSSIEYARHADEYRILPGISIASEGPVGSILLESPVGMSELDGCDVFVPSASATSVVLLRALLELRSSVCPRFHVFEQGVTDPFEQGATAALWIGDVAMRREARAGSNLFDLGSEWTRWTGLPFVYALWQVRAGHVDGPGIEALHSRLLEQRDSLPDQWSELGRMYEPEIGLPAPQLVDYWRALRFDLGPDTRSGLLRFYALAADLGEAPRVSTLRWFEER